MRALRHAVPSAAEVVAMSADHAAVAFACVGCFDDHSEGISSPDASLTMRLLRATRTLPDPASPRPTPSDPPASPPAGAGHRDRARDRTGGKACLAH